MTKRAAWRFVWGLALAASAVAVPSVPSAWAQYNRPAPRAAPDEDEGPKGLDPESHDAIDLYSHLCVSTRGDRDRAAAIIGEGDSAVEPMDAPLLRGLENGASGGMGWIIRMPLGDRLIVEFPPSGACIVRAPRVEPALLEAAFRNLLDQFAASGQFKIHREGEQTKMIDAPARSPDGDRPHSEKWPGEKGPGGKLKYHFLDYTMLMPDTGRTAELALATTESRAVSIQATLSFLPQSAAP